MLYMGRTTLTSLEGKRDLLALLTDALADELIKPATTAKKHSGGGKVKNKKRAGLTDKNGNSPCPKRVKREQPKWRDVMITTQPKKQKTKRSVVQVKCEPKRCDVIDLMTTKSKQRAKRSVVQVKCEPNWSDDVMVTPQPKQRAKKIRQVQPEPIVVESPVVRLEKLNVPHQRSKFKKHRQRFVVKPEVIKSAVVKLAKFDGGLAQQMTARSLFLCPICDAVMTTRADVKSHSVKVHNIPTNCALRPVQVWLPQQPRQKKSMPKL